MASAPTELQLQYCCAYLRRKYATATADLVTLADTVAATSMDAVTLTNVGLEGSSGGGQVTFDRTILGMAIEQVLIELAVTTQPTGNAFDLPDWSAHPSAYH